MGGGCVLVTGGLGFIGARALDCDTGERGWRGKGGGTGARRKSPPPAAPAGFPLLACLSLRAPSLASLPFRPCSASAPSGPP